MIKKINAFGVLILAAGSSSRLGEAKQLLPFKNENLIRHAVKVALAVQPEKTAVVLGAAADRIQEEITQFPVVTLINSQYEEGIASSIRCGVAYFLAHHPHLDGLIIMLCDQPYVEAWLLQALVNTKREQEACRIVASFYEGDLGVPALFDRQLFSELLQLKGDKGAKSLIKQYKEEAAQVAFPLGSVDIDTQEAYQKWI